MAVSVRSRSSKGRSASGERSRGSDLSKAEGAGEDVALVCGVSGDGESVDIIRKRGDRLEAGTVRRLEQGKPIHGEVVRLKPRDNSPLLYDVEVQLPARAETSPSVTSGPAQVATESYRKNWEAIYGARHKKQRQLLN